MTFFKLHVIANYKDGEDAAFSYQTPYNLDDMLGIVKTLMEYDNEASSFVFTVVREREEVYESYKELTDDKTRV